MAMVNCSECGKEISDKAASCPHCGAPQAAQKPPVTCPNCGKEAAPGDAICRDCKRVLSTKNQRRCLTCGYVGTMKTWLRNYNLPQFVAFILLLFWIIPGLIFIAWGWGKYKCPQCGALGKSAAAAQP